MKLPWIINSISSKQKQMHKEVEQELEESKFERNNIKKEHQEISAQILALSLIANMLASKHRIIHK